MFLPSEKVVFICFNGSLLKKMKNAFYFMLELFFTLKIFIFLSRFFGNVKKQFDEKAKVNFKFYDVTYWTINNCIVHIFSSIFRTKGK